METLLHHGGYPTTTCFTIITHAYAGSTSGYVEVLEIKNPPVSKIPFIVHIYEQGKSLFYEFNSVDDAKKYASTFISLSTIGYYDATKKLWKRRIDCHELEPWFYAKQLGSIVYDFVIPETYSINDKYFTKDASFIIFQDKYVSCKKVLAVCSEENTVSIYWNDATHTSISKAGHMEVIPYTHPEWKGELLRKWWHLINGTERYFRFVSKELGEFEMEIEDTSKEVEESEAIILADGDPEGLLGIGAEIDKQYLITFSQIAKKYPNDPIAPITKNSISISGMFVINNKLAKIDSFADILLEFFSKNPS